MKKQLIFLLLTSALFLSGCSGPDMEVYTQQHSGYRAYVVTSIDIEQDQHNSIKEYDFSYTVMKEENPTEEMETEESEIYECVGYHDDCSNGMKHVRSARECPYGYKNCYVIDEQYNEYLYLVDSDM